MRESKIGVPTLYFKQVELRWILEKKLENVIQNHVHRRSSRREFL